MNLGTSEYVIELRKKILQGLADGVRPKVMAGQFILSTRTIETHIAHLKIANNCTNIIHLVAMAVREKVIV